MTDFKKSSMARASPTKPFAAFFALLLAVVAAGCATPASRVAGAAAPDVHAILKERAEARWSGLINGDFAKAYAFETPAYREVNPLRLYVSRFGSQLRWDAAEVTGVQPDETGETALVTVLVSYTSMNSVGGVLNGQRPVEEHWIKTGGEWWHTN
jgi:hypothetical protein